MSVLHNVVVLLLITFTATAEAGLPAGAVMRLGSASLVHPGRIVHLRFSHDDSMLYASDASRNMRVWDIATGTRLWETDRFGGFFDLSPDGRFLATNVRNEVLIWDLRAEREHLRLPANATAIQFSGDGSLIVTAGGDEFVRVWNPETGGLKRVFECSSRDVRAVAISGDGGMVACEWGSASSITKEVVVWDVQSEGEPKRLRGAMEGSNSYYRGWVSDLEFSADGKRLAVATTDGVTIYDIDRQKELGRFKKCGRDIALSPRTGAMASAGGFGIYDTTSFEQSIKFQRRDQAYISCLTYSRDGRLVASGTDSGKIQLWDGETGRRIRLGSGHDGGIRDADYSPDGTLIVSVSRDDATVRLWGATTGRQLRTFSITWRGSDVWWNEEGSDVKFAPYGGEVMTWLFDSTIHYFPLGGDKRVVQLETAKRYAPGIVTLAFSLDGTRSASAEHGSGSIQTVNIHDLDGGKRISTFNPYGNKRSSDNWISSMAFSPDGRLLAIGMRKDHSDYRPSPSVYLFKTEDQTLVRSLRMATAPPSRMRFSPDGALLATAATYDHPAQVFRVADGTEVNHFAIDAETHGRDPTGLAFTSDGRLLAASDNKQNVFVWELATNKQIHAYHGHDQPITSLTFSPDGTRLLSSSEDGTMLVWMVRRRPVKRATYTRHQLDGLWESIADAESIVASSASDALMKSPKQTVELLSKRLTAGPVLDNRRLPQLVKDLISDSPKRRQAAESDLTAFGSRAEQPLYAALARATESQRLRIERVLATIGEFPIPAEELRRSRAIVILEQIGSEPATTVLKRLAATQPPTAAAHEARQALERLKSRARRTRR